MRRSAIVAIATFMMLTLGSSTALAANVHFKHGSPVFTDQGVTLTASGALTGLGNGDVVITVTARGTPTAACTNPAGATQPPGQNPAEVVLTGVQGFPAADIKNG